MSMSIVAVDLARAAEVAPIIHRFLADGSSSPRSQAVGEYAT